MIQVQETFVEEEYLVSELLSKPKAILCFNVRNTVPCV